MHTHQKNISGYARLEPFGNEQQTRKYVQTHLFLNRIASRCIQCGFRIFDYIFSFVVAAVAELPA